MLLQDPVMLMSVINMKLRDENVNLTELCKRLDVPEQELTAKLQKAGFAYDAASNRFM